MRFVYCRYKIIWGLLEILEISFIDIKKVTACLNWKEWFCDWRIVITATDTPKCGSNFHFGDSIS